MDGIAAVCSKFISPQATAIKFSLLERETDSNYKIYQLRIHITIAKQRVSLISCSKKLHVGLIFKKRTKVTKVRKML